MLALFQSVEPGGSPDAEGGARGGVAAEVFPALGFRLCLLNFCMWRPCRADEEPVGSPDAENGARGGVALQRLIFFLKSVDLICGI